MKARRLVIGLAMFVMYALLLFEGRGEINPVFHLLNSQPGKEHPVQNAKEQPFQPFRVEASAFDGTLIEDFPPLSEVITVDPLPLMEQAPKVRGLYATGWSAGSVRAFPKILDVLDATYLNAIVIDVKDDSGTLSYKSEVPLALEIGSGRKKIANISEIMSILNEKKIYPIARIVVFKDPFLAKARPDLAVKSKHGGLWRDYKGLNWVDPHSKTVWRYVVDVAKEAAKHGFKEIQFDYVRFTSDGDLSDCLYPFADGRKKHEVIREFLRYAYKELKPLGVVVSADIFGLVLSVPDDLGIGQQLEEIAQEVDLICPMVYPSHYYPGTFGIKNPNAAPYETILRSLKDAQRRITGMKAKIRPWLQDFTLGQPAYEKEQLAAQLRAVKEIGIEEWLWWNPSNRYNPHKHNFTDPEIIGIMP